MDSCRWTRTRGRARGQLLPDLSRGLPRRDRLEPHRPTTRIQAKSDLRVYRSSVSAPTTQGASAISIACRSSCASVAVCATIGLLQLSSTSNRRASGVGVSTLRKAVRPSRVSVGKGAIRT